MWPLLIIANDSLESGQHVREVSESNLRITHQKPKRLEEALQFLSQR